MCTIEAEIKAERLFAGQYALRELGIRIGMDDFQPQEWFTLERVQEHIRYLEDTARAQGARHALKSDS